MNRPQPYSEVVGIRGVEKTPDRILSRMLALFDPKAAERITTEVGQKVMGILHGIVEESKPEDTLEIAIVRENIPHPEGKGQIIGAQHIRIDPNTKHDNFNFPGVGMVSEVSVEIVAPELLVGRPGAMTWVQRTTPPEETLIVRDLSSGILTGRGFELVRSTKGILCPYDGNISINGNYEIFVKQLGEIDQNGVTSNTINQYHPGGVMVKIFSRSS